MPHFLHQIERSKNFTLAEARSAAKLLIAQITERSREEGAGLPQIVGQEKLIRRLVSAFLIGEHCLLEGLPGLVKTEVSKTLAAMLGLVFKRIQFTPDIMPSDLIGRERLEIRNGQPSIQPEPGPIFTNILLADEINRASPKVQSALLEASEERQVTALHRQTVRIRPRGLVNGREINEEEILAGEGYFGETLETMKMDQLQHFMVLATMNPIELEGVFPLSEAQIDRFAYKLLVDYPSATHLSGISRHAFDHPRIEFSHNPDDHKKTLYFLSLLRRKLLGSLAEERWMNVHHDLRTRCETLVNFTHLGRPSRQDSEFGESLTSTSLKQEELLAQIAAWSKKPEEKERANWIQKWRTASEYPDVQSGSSPRGLLKLIRAIHVEAFLDGELYGEVPNPSWKQVTEVAADVLRHRIRLSSAPSTAGANTTEFINGLVEWLRP